MTSHPTSFSPWQENLHEIFGPVWYPPCHQQYSSDSCWNFPVQSHPTDVHTPRAHQTHGHSSYAFPSHPTQPAALKTDPFTTRLVYETPGTPMTSASAPMTHRSRSERQRERDRDCSRNRRISRSRSRSQSKRRRRRKIVLEECASFSLESTRQFFEEKIPCKFITCVQQERESEEGNEKKWFQDWVAEIELKKKHRLTSDRLRRLCKEFCSRPIEVENIIGHRPSYPHNISEVKVLWKGYDASQATWEPIENVKGLGCFKKYVEVNELFQYVPDDSDSDSEYNPHE